MTASNTPDPQRLADTIHAIRGSLNRVTMHAEVAKLALAGDVPSDKGEQSLCEVIENAKRCSELLHKLIQE